MNRQRNISRNTIVIMPISNIIDVHILRKVKYNINHLMITLTKLFYIFSYKWPTAMEKKSDA